jgi:hypothetical protein
VQQTIGRDPSTVSLGHILARTNTRSGEAGVKTAAIFCVRWLGFVFLDGGPDH